MLHPATLLLLWVGFAIAAGLVSAAALATAAILALMLALTLARRRCLALLRRSRWLLISIAVVFAFATPGLNVPGWPGRVGITQDGLVQATEHLARLLALLATLALLHERLGNRGFLAGLHWLLAPLARWRNWRERLLVRLMLVLEFVEHEPPGKGWKAWLVDSSPGPRTMTLATRRMAWPDGLLLFAAACGLGALGW